MAQYYTITFRSSVKTKKYDSKGKLLYTEVGDSVIKMDLLPYGTAMGYSTCPDFTIAPYEPVNDNKRSGRDNSVGNGTKKVGSSYRTQSDYSSARSVTAKAPAPSKVATAAATGNMGAALNA